MHKTLIYAGFALSAYIIVYAGSVFFGTPCRSIKPNNVLMKPRKHKVDPGHKVSFYRTLYSNIKLSYTATECSDIFRQIVPKINYSIKGGCLKQFSSASWSF